MKRFKATITLMTESMEYDEKEKAYIGYDPDSIQDHGVVNTYTAKTMKELRSKIEAEHSLSAFEEFDGRLEAQFSGEHHYNTPKAEQIPFQETFTIYLSQVTELELTPADLWND